MQLFQHIVSGVPYSLCAVLQDEIKSARTETQQEIQLTVHLIYELLVKDLINTEKIDALSVGKMWHSYSLAFRQILKEVFMHPSFD